MPASSLFADMERSNSGLEDQRALQLAFELSMLGFNENSPTTTEQTAEPITASYPDENRSKKSQNMTECVPVPSSEHVAEIVGRQGRIWKFWIYYWLLCFLSWFILSVSSTSFLRRVSRWVSEFFVFSRNLERESQPTITFTSKRNKFRRNCDTSRMKLATQQTNYLLIYLSPKSKKCMNFWESMRNQKNSLFFKKCL